jgi:NAD(P)-dependent dehydrogenase (short-subunit alcohol dehydrogenase family)
MDLELGTKVVLITGGTDGLGLSLACRLAEEGAAVAVCGRDEQRLAQAVARVEALGGTVLGVQADVSQAAQVTAFVEASVDRFGRIDGVVHNAGKSAASPLESSDDAAWEADLELKLMGALRLTRATLPHLKINGGAVLFTLAMSAKAPGAASGPSAISRAAGMALMKSLSKELGPAGIRVNALLIGLMESGQWERAAQSSGQEVAEFYDRLAEGSNIPLGRVGRAEEFADVAAFLLSPRSSYLTGTAINIDGGLSPAV